MVGWFCFLRWDVASFVCVLGWFGGRPVGSWMAGMRVGQRSGWLLG